MTRARPKVLVFNLFYLPGYRAGGPIRTLANMVERLGAEIDFRLVTLDRDLGDLGPYPIAGANRWVRMGNAQVRYLERAAVTSREIVDIVEEVGPDFLYLNSFFDPVFTQRVLWARWLRKVPAVPVVIAPRGEFSSAALGLKAVKKSAYIGLMRILGIYRGLVWHASSDEEKGDILRRLPFVSLDEVRVAMNLAPAPEAADMERTDWCASEKLRICFLGRIAPMKNLDYALKVLAGVRVPVNFSVYGPVESESYWKECQAMIKKLPSNIEVEYLGAVESAHVKRTLAKHDLFFFPTRGENYGHVIHEALSAGLPVLISDRTPWTRLEEMGVGWAFALDAGESFARKIEEVSGWSRDVRRAVAESARRFGTTVAGDASVLAGNRALFFE